VNSYYNIKALVEVNNDLLEKLGIFSLCKVMCNFFVKGISAKFIFFPR